jgi:1-acyl-sn-glycerol-3-phosphate acyltransferase
LINTVIASATANVARLVAGSAVECRVNLDTTQRVYVANHTSHLDFVLIWSSLPRQLRLVTHPVAAQDYWERSAIRRYLAGNVFQSVLIERAAHQSSSAQAAVDRMLEAMGDTHSLILFPEGTRGNGDILGPFKSGLYYLCRAKPQIQVLPVFLQNLNRILPKGEFLPVPMLSRIIFGDPICLEEGEPKAAFLERARSAVQVLGKYK